METPIHRSVRLSALEGFARSESLKARKERPLLVVRGDFSHFQQSTLAKVAAAGYFDIADASDWKAADHAGRPVAAIRWREGEKVPVPSGSFRSVINDVPFIKSRDAVQKALKRAAGYNSAVDPRQHVGPGVIRSATSAGNDGIPTEFPVTAEQYSAKRSYESLIDNVCGEIGGQNYVVDITLSLVGNAVPYCYLKFRKERNRFQAANEQVVLAIPTDVLTTQELEICRQTVRHLKLGYAEINVLRSSSTDRIYIVGVDETPLGPPPELSDEGAKMAIRLLGSTIADRWWLA